MYPAFLPSVLRCLFYSHHLCCCGRISPSRRLLYLEAKHYQSVQLAACDSILTDQQHSKQPPLFMSRSFVCLSATPLSFFLTSLIVLSFLFTPLLTFPLLSSFLYYLHQSQCFFLPFLPCLYCFFMYFNLSVLVSFIQSSFSFSSSSSPFSHPSSLYKVYYCLFYLAL